MSAGRKTGSSKNLKDFDKTLLSTPSGKRRKSYKKQKKRAEGRGEIEENSIDYINVVEEHVYGEFESVVGNGEEKNRYTVTNDNYINAQVNFANCGACIIVSLCIISLQMLNTMII